MYMLHNIKYYLLTSTPQWLTVVIKCVFHINIWKNSNEFHFIIKLLQISTYIMTHIYAISLSPLILSRFIAVKCCDIFFFQKNGDLIMRVRTF